MPKKALDSRIPTLIRNTVQSRERSIFIIVGDRGRDQVVHLHHILSLSKVTARPSVLWMYKKDLLGFSSHKKKREAKLKKQKSKGQEESPFDMFVAATDIKYCYYKESERILGNTFGMLVLQDFEALRPNLLARTIETVQGGGMVCILLKTMTSLKQLYTMTMDIHSRYRTDAHEDVVPRFNERFLLSLGTCETCLVVDDELNVIPVSGARNVKPLPPPPEDQNDTPQLRELKVYQSKFSDQKPLGPLVETAKTLDQAKAVVTFVEAIAEKTLRSTVALTASRGRGKSAALGLAVAAAIAHGYSNIFITSPTPENLRTLFEFIFKGFDALKYDEHLDYDIIQSTNPTFNKAIVRVNVFRNHRQTIQYIRPEDAHVLGQAELVVIDEAAAIPLPLVKKLIGPYLVFMASTINGYEGTGRSLSLKLIQQLREQSRGYLGKASKTISDETGTTVNREGNPAKANASASTTTSVPVGGRTLREIKLSEPIRYAPNDSVEKWLNALLCLDATNPSSSRFALTQGCPHPSECQLWAISRDTLFSFHPVSEAFLQKVMALYVASHYKNSPNDLQPMSDAPAHQLFVLLAPVNPNDTALPEPLCVIQVALEGEISKQTIINSLSRGQRTDGDMIPQLVAMQFQDPDFASLSGGRIVRIATSPEYIKMGYGSRALELLTDFYEGKFTNLDESNSIVEEDGGILVTDQDIEDDSLMKDSIKIRDPKNMPPLLIKLSQKKSSYLHYLGVSYGLTQQLHRFWKRAGYVPVYLRQTAQELTGEHSCVMLKVLEGRDKAWLGAYSEDFRRRFSSLLSFEFRKFPSVLSLSVIEAAQAGSKEHPITPKPLTKPDLSTILSPYDLKRLESYANNMLDYHVILDLLPLVADLYFSNRLQISLSGVQRAILLSIGLQRKGIDDLEKELSLPSGQLMAMFIKIVKKVSSAFREIQKTALLEELPAEQKTNGDVDDGEKAHFAPLEEDLDEEMQEAGNEAVSALKEKQRELINSLDLQKFALGGTDDDWSEALATKGKKPDTGMVVSVKSGKDKKRKGESLKEVTDEYLQSQEKTKKKKKKHHH